MNREQTLEPMQQQARILIVGLGALGSNAAQLLIERGARSLVLYDYDIVQRENLTVHGGACALYTDEDVGASKVDAAKRRLQALAPDADITAIAQPFDAMTPLEKIDLIVDGTDDLGVRLLMNDRAVQHHIALIIGAASSTHGMVFTIKPEPTGTRQWPCWQCVAHNKTSMLGCERMSAALASAIAHVQVDEVVKMLTPQSKNTTNTPDRQLATEEELGAAPTLLLVSHHQIGELNGRRRQVNSDGREADPDDENDDEDKEFNGRRDGREENPDDGNDCENAKLDRQKGNPNDDRSGRSVELVIQRIIVAKNPSCAACVGRFDYLDAPRRVERCATSGRLVVRPSKPIVLDLDDAVARTNLTIIERYASAVRLRLGDGTVLVHRHGLLEFEGVDAGVAEEFAKRVVER